MGRDKIKILQFPIANSNGGITHYALGNWKWMDKARFQCDFATMSGHLDFCEEIYATGSKIYYISCYAEENKEKFAEEFDSILSHGYDVVHLHTKQWKSFMVEEMCKRYQVPKVIVHSHSTSIDASDEGRRKKEEQLHEKMKQLFNKDMATDFWACSMSAADFMFGGRIPADRVKIMPNAIDISRFGFDSETRAKYRREYNLGDGLVIGHVGRFEYPKNQEFLIDVFREVSKRISDAKLVLVGGGSRLTQMRDKADLMKLGDKILFTGSRDDVSSWYQVMDIFCFPSVFEGLPISMIEAQAAGLPCLGSKHISQEVGICDNVYLLPLNIEIWVNKIMDMVKSGRRDNTDRLIQQGYDIKTQVKCIEKEYCSSRSSDFGW